MGVPFADLYSQYLSIKDEVDAVITDVIKKSAFVRGPYVEKFEQEFAGMMERKYCVSCANGTDSLYIALKSLGVGAGDEVIAPAHSWISTTETITQANGTVVFCDTDSTYTIDADKIESLITPRTVGIVPVHLYGQPADMDKIMLIAEKHKLWVLEDCAQAHLAKYKGKLVGTFGNVASFSFYPGKNLGAMGDAGALITNDMELAREMAMFARHGGERKGEHVIEGINSRMDGLQAAILSVKLPYLQGWTIKRQQLAEKYFEILASVSSVELPQLKDDVDHVYHLFVVQHSKRNELAAYLKERGIQTVVNYPTALPFLPAYSRFKCQPEDFPVAYRNQSQILSLPIFPEMSFLQVEMVATAIDGFCG